jgi:hypothetical protein
MEQDKLKILGPHLSYFLKVSRIVCIGMKSLFGVPGNWMKP